MIMQKLVSLFTMKCFDRYKSSSESATSSEQSYSISSQSSSNSVSSGSFVTLKLTAEKLMKEKACVKTDLDLANSKLEKLTECVSVLEEKLQNAINENANFKVKQKENEKLWKGLESKFSLTKTLCDQLTETLQYLACQVHHGENDKEFLEGKLSASGAALDNLHEHMKTLSLKLDASEDVVIKCEKEFEVLSIEKQEMKKSFEDKVCRAANLIQEKDAKVKLLEEIVEANREDIDSLTSEIENLHLSLRLKDYDLQSSKVSKEALVEEKNNLLSINKKFIRQLDMALRERKNLEDFIKLLAGKLVELDNQSMTYLEKFVLINALYDSFSKLFQEEKNLGLQRAKNQYDHIHEKFLLVTSEKEKLKLITEELNCKIIELQKDQEIALSQHGEYIHEAEGKIQKLESEAENLLSTKSRLEILIAEAEEKISYLSYNSRIFKSKLQDLLAKISVLESESKDSTTKLFGEIQIKTEEADSLRKEIEKNVELVDSIQKQVNDLQTLLEEKGELILQFKEREKFLENQKSEVQVSLTNAENKLVEARKRYDQMLECKQSELLRHLKELSERNDQAINDIRRKFEADKLESLSLEKEKAKRALQKMERKHEEMVAEYKEEARKYLARIQEEHASLIIRMQQDHDKKEMALKSDHIEEIKRFKVQAENELIQKIMQLKFEQEIQLKFLKQNHEDRYRKLHEELRMQKDKEERQRKLLQLQWKVMSDNPQEDQEISLKKNYSKTRNFDSNMRSQCDQVDMESDQEDSPYRQKESQTRVTNLSKEVEKGNPTSVINVSKHHKKVTHHEYEVETANGRTITKRTKRTVMFGDTRKHKKRKTPEVNTASAMLKGIKGSKKNSSNIVDLFQDGYLDPYAHDPYTFD